MKPIGNQATNGVHLDYDPAGQHLKPRMEFLRNLFPRDCNQQTVISVCVSLIAICTFALGFFCKYNWDHLSEWYSIMVVICLGVTQVFSFLIIISHEQCQEPQKYKVSMARLFCTYQAIDCNRIRPEPRPEPSSLRVADYTTKLHFQMPWVPVLPICSIMINAILMTTLQLLTWGRLVIWLAIGE